MIIFYTPKFSKQFSKLPLVLQELAQDKELIFRTNPFDSRLRTHKLHGQFASCLSFSLNHKYRIIFSYTEDKKDVIFLAIGAHDIYE